MAAHSFGADVFESIFVSSDVSMWGPAFARLLLYSCQTATRWKHFPSPLSQVMFQLNNYQSNPCPLCSCSPRTTPPQHLSSSDLSITFPSQKQLHTSRNLIMRIKACQWMSVGSKQLGFYCILASIFANINKINTNKTKYSILYKKWVMHLQWKWMGPTINIKIHCFKSKNHKTLCVN